MVVVAYLRCRAHPHPVARLRKNGRPARLARHAHHRVLRVLGRSRWGDRHRVGADAMADSRPVATSPGFSAASSRRSPSISWERCCRTGSRPSSTRICDRSSSPVSASSSPRWCLLAALFLLFFGPALAGYSWLLIGSAALGSVNVGHARASKIQIPVPLAGHRVRENAPCFDGLRHLGPPPMWSSTRCSHRHGDSRHGEPAGGYRELLDRDAAHEPDDADSAAAASAGFRSWRFRSIVRRRSAGKWRGHTSRPTSSWSHRGGSR